MKKSVVLVFLLLLPFIGAEASEQKSYEMPRTQVVPIQDTKSDRQYELYIKLPEGYEKNTDLKYPVIYTGDAIWHMDMLSGATEYLMPNVILVGISWQKDLEGEVAHASRFRDYSLVKDTESKNPRGEAGNHLSFIRDDVIKLVENNYRADPNERAYFGYSLGVQLGAYILFAQPDTFKHYIFGSPAFSERSGIYIDELEAKMAPQQQELNANVFVSIGELEESEMRDVEDFVSVLQRRSQAGLTLTGLEIIEDADHGTAFPVTAIRSMKWLSHMSDGSHAQGEIPDIKGPYLGQEPPGLTPNVFAPGIVSTKDWEIEGVFAPNMNEFYFARYRGTYDDAKTYVIQYENGAWHESVVEPRSGEVFISTDDKTMHLGKKYRERTTSGWSEKKSLGPMFEREDWGIMRLTASAMGTYVFDDYKSDVIRMSTLVDGKRQEPKKMGPVVNTGKWTAHPFIAPDESYLIWDSEREGGFGESDLYISFRQEDGSWGPAINMGDKVNSDKWDAYASVTPDGKYILFNRGVDPENDNVDIYWVSANIIDELRPKESNDR